MLEQGKLLNFQKSSTQSGETLDGMKNLSELKKNCFL